MSVPTKIVKTKLFIGNLDPGTQTEELNELFAPFGAVLEASVIKDYGFVHFGSIEEAEKASAALNNREFHGKRLRVELSTSTVRHRPGQPEPASALKHPRARAGVKGDSDGVARYYADASAGGGGGGPMRHQPSAWARQDARPYDSLPYPHAAYERALPYDTRVDARRYYDDRRENTYPPEYEIASYAGSSAGAVGGSRLYRELPPPPPPAPPSSSGRTDSYGANRPYDRPPGMPPVDPYYGGGLPQGPPPSVDPYQSYDPYAKYYASRPREPEYPTQREYDPYSNYRSDAYASPSSQALRRQDSPADMRSPQAPYPAPHRQQQQQQQPPLPPPPPQSYPTGSSSYAQFYGIHQR